MNKFEAAEYLGLSVAWLMKLVSRNKIPYHQMEFGNLLYFLYHELKEWKYKHELFDAIKHGTYHPDIVNRVIL